MSRPTGTPRLLREINDRTALGLLLQHGTMTRPQLVAATGFSKPTASQVLTRLVEKGLVVQNGTLSGGRGPSAQVYAINPAAGFSIGVDVTPTNVVASVNDITGRAVGTAAGTVDMQSAPQPAAAVAAVVRQAARRARVSLGEAGQLVIASPGVHDPEGDRIKHAEHMPAWAEPGVCSELCDRLGVPILFENDVNVAAVAERSRGAASEVGSFALLWVGTGLGLAIDLGGALHRGFTGGAGEVGYMPLPGFGENAGRGSSDFQTLVREEAVVALGRDRGLAGRTPAEVLAAAYDDRKRGKPFLEEIAERLATGSAMIVSVLDPEMLVLAGPTARAGGEMLRALVEQRVRRLTPLRPTICLSAVDGNPVLAGAVEVGLQALRHQLFTSTTPTAPVALSR